MTYSPTEFRLAMHANDYDPIAAVGKAPVQPEWQTKIRISREDVAQMEVRWPTARNTGAVCERTPSLDVDVLDPEAAEMVWDAVKDWFGARGNIIRRVGLAPKFLIPFRTNEPFSKIQRQLEAPNGTIHKLEFLGKGQQFIAAGVHPDTKAAYEWFTGRSLENTPRADLPEISGQEAEELVTYLADMLTEKFGFLPWEDRAGNDGGNGADSGEWRTPVDVEAELAAMADGKSVNLVQCAIIPSMLRKGEHPDDVLDLVVDETMARVGNRLGWTREEEEKAVNRRIRSGYDNLLLKDYDYSSGVVPTWLPGDFHKVWIDILAKNGRPLITRNRYGYYVREEKRDEANTNPPGNESEEDQEAPKEAPKASSNERRVLVLHPATPVDEANLPPRSWLYGKHYQRRTVSLTAGPGGLGKSSLNLVEAIAMATGRNLLGEQPDARLRVWYHNGDDPREEIDRRRAAICRYYKIPQEELEGWLWITSGLEFPLRVAKGYANLEIDAVLVRQISNAIAENQIDVATFDPTRIPTFRI